MIQAVRGTISLTFTAKLSGLFLSCWCY